MSKNDIPLKEFSIAKLFIDEKKSSYSIPIYQRNYAWGEDEIRTLVQDVYDAFESNKAVYYIGTLVSYKRDENVFEIIDGQQRLTTIYIILCVLGEKNLNPLTYKARSKSNKTLKRLSEINELAKLEEKDDGIIDGFRIAKAAIDDIVSNEKKEKFVEYFKTNVHIIHYKVPKDVDLNHYFEIMNSRGEQLEKHEIEKAQLMQKLNPTEQKTFNEIWEACSNMSFYVQRNFKDNLAGNVFGKNYNDFVLDKFDDLKSTDNSEQNDNTDSKEISEIISGNFVIAPNEEKEKNDAFQPIIDFSNFLLIVLKITRTQKEGKLPDDFKLDDKELLKEFDKITLTQEFVKDFAYNLLKARFFLDNYIVHHSNEEDTYESNPWELEILVKDNDKNKYNTENLSENKEIQDKLVHLLSMFEVSFTAHQRKNYLFYCLYYLMSNDFNDKEKYLEFAENLADRYFFRIYLDKNSLNEINTPLPGKFDEKIFSGNNFDETELPKKTLVDFSEIYGDGTEKSKGVPLFIFNYLDFKIWKLYLKQIKGKNDNQERHNLFEKKFGCSDFGLKIFDKFYFSRTRRSLEHYFPQANVKDSETPTETHINCFGNYAMIGSAANSSGSNWSPKSKLDHYLDSSEKINQISVASLKFIIMMQKCKDNKDNKKERNSGDEWNFQDIQEHQQKMMEILFC